MNYKVGPGRCVCGLRLPRCGWCLMALMWHLTVYFILSSCFGWVIRSVEPKIYCIHHWEQARNAHKSTLGENKSAQAITAITLSSPVDGNHICHYWLLSLYLPLKYSWVICCYLQRGKDERADRERDGKETPDAVKGLVSISLLCRIPGCVGVQAQAGEVMMLNVLEDAPRWLLVIMPNYVRYILWAWKLAVCGCGGVKKQGCR